MKNEAARSFRKNVGRNKRSVSGLYARAGNGLRPYPGLRKGVSPRSNENRCSLLVPFGKVKNGDPDDLSLLINSLKNIISQIAHVAFGVEDGDIRVVRVKLPLRL